MHGIVPLDPSGEGVSQPGYATVYMPKFKANRNRFPASCVQPCATGQEAIEAAQDDARRFPALLIGPSKSSEGQFIYYLVRWL